MTAPRHLEPLPNIVYDTALGAAVADVTDGTEADPAAVLLHLLAGVGAAVGPNAHCDWSGRVTPARLFVLVIGGTGSGKGESERVAMRLLRAAVPAFCEDGIAGGLVSGEGLLAALGGESASPVDEDSPDTMSAPVVGRRLLTIEPEFGRVLAASSRDGATLSHLLRELWDKDSAASLSRQRPLRVKGAHLALVGHVTQTELRRLADTNAIENGFLNRFLPIAVRRGALRPFGATASGQAALRREEAEATVRLAVEHGRQLGHVPLARDAHDLWTELYMRLAPERPFLLGSLVARGIAHIQRLALLFAIGDRDDRVRLIHLDAAAAVWARSEATWADLYGQHLGDQLAERILARLHEEGGPLTRSDLRAPLSKAQRGRLDEVRDLLVDAGAVRVHRLPPGPEGGRPVEFWYAVDDPENLENPGKFEVAGVAGVTGAPHEAEAPDNKSSGNGGHGAIDAPCSPLTPNLIPVIGGAS